MSTLLSAHGDPSGDSPMWCDTGRPLSSIASHTGYMAGEL